MVDAHRATWSTGGNAYETDDGVYLQAGAGRGLRAARPPVARERSQAGARVEANEEKRLADRLRAVEEGQAGRAVVAVAVGCRAAPDGTPNAS